MKTAAQILAVASAFTAVYAQNPIIQSPASLVQCQPALVTFSGGTAPYYISVLPGGQASAAALEQFPPQSGNSYTWTVNIASGQDITLSIRDSTGAINYSSQVPIQASSDSSCLNGSASSAGSSSSEASSSSSSSSSSSAASSSSSAASSSAASSTGSSSAPATTTSGRNANANGSTSAAAPASTSPTGGAGKYLANMGAVAGVAGVVALML